MFKAEEHIAAVSRAMGNSNRIKILWLLVQCEHSVDQLTRKTEISFANVSQHLQSMLKNGLVKNRKEQNKVIYRISHEAIIDLLIATQNAARLQKPEIDRLVYTDHQGNEIPTIHPEEAWKIIRHDSTKFVDVRPPEEFESGHIPGAVSLPVDEANDVSAKQLELDKEESVIVYGRHAFCPLPELLIKKLSHSPYNFFRLEGGTPEWFYGGWPIAKN